MKRYIFHSDPAHGWIQVPAAELVKLGIQHEISPHSYWSSGFAYLEEDCDLSVFFRAKEAAGEPIAWEEIQEIPYQGEAPIRQMMSFKGIYAELCS